jgi:hypothetical protein
VVGTESESNGEDVEVVSENKIGEHEMVRVNEAW